MQSARTVLLLRAGVLAAAAALVASCGSDCPPPAAADPSKTGEPPVPLFTCRDAGGQGPRAAIGADASFEEYLQSVRRECGSNGKFLVDGDVGISGVKLLREHFEQRSARADPADEPGPLTLAAPGAMWPAQRKRSLTYCVGSAFGAQHDKVVADMEAATGAWEQVASVEFDHVAAQDATCDAQNTAVIFDVNPVDVGGYYRVRAFFPGEPRADRNVYVDLGALSFDPAQPLQLSGVLRHALGHVLGFPHEPARADGGCAHEDASVMHDPACDDATRKLLLTDRDKNGAACLYGSAPGFSIDPSICAAPLPPVPPTDAPIAKRFENQAVARAALKEYGPFGAKPGSLVRVSMRPRGPRPGDPDLYVRLGGKPMTRPPAFACRPYLTGALETCELDAGAPPNNLVRILVHGYTSGSYDLEVSFVPLAP